MRATSGSGHQPSGLQPPARITTHQGVCVWEKGLGGGGGVLGVGGGGVGLGLGRGMPVGLALPIHSHSVAAVKEEEELKMRAHAPFMAGGHWKEHVGGDATEHTEHKEHAEEEEKAAGHCKEHKDQLHMPAHQRPLHRRGGGERGSSGCVRERWAEEQRPESAPAARAHAGSEVWEVSLSAHATAAKRETVTVTGGGGAVGTAPRGGGASSKELVPASCVAHARDGKEHAHTATSHLPHRSSSLASHVGHAGRSLAHVAHVAHVGRRVSLAHLARPVVACSSLHDEQHAGARARAAVGEVRPRPGRPSSSYLRCLPLHHPTSRDRGTDTDTDTDREVWERDGGEGRGSKLPQERSNLPQERSKLPQERSKLRQVCANGHEAPSLPPHVAHAAQLADKCKHAERVSDESESVERRHDESESLERRHDTLLPRPTVSGMCLHVTSHVTTASTLSAPPTPPRHGTRLRASSPPQTVHSSHDTALPQPYVMEWVWMQSMDRRLRV
jgi:hypothetical protein